MNSITSISNLIFYKAEKYQYNTTNEFDASTCPRPHYCMGLIISGGATFTDCEDQTKIEVMAGDIIFVPMGSRYISSWYGTPLIEYISMHFIFGSLGLFSKNNSYKLQRVKVPNFEKYKEIFRSSLNAECASDQEKLKIISNFLSVLADIQPQLQKRKHTCPSPKILASLKFIEDNYKEKISVEDLAAEAQMSISRFYPFFKKELGITPIDYINNYRISRAILLLIEDNNDSIENISEQTGFESSAYFRRVFRKVTGLSPREYKKTSLEL